MTKRAKQWIGLAVLLATVGIGSYFYLSGRRPHVYRPRPAGTLTFNRHIAPVVYTQCAPCHRPGQAAPFSLLSYDDVRKRAEQIVEVTQQRYMPPWLPQEGFGKFQNQRRLTVDQLGMIAQWTAEGASEGKAADLPTQPKWPEGWQLGAPDLVLVIPEAYTLRADGPDLYRNFVVGIPIKEKRFVKAVEFDPGNAAIVHHAFLRLDPTRQSRRRDELDPAPGFDGIHPPPTAAPPEGHFLSWQPGKRPSVAAEGSAWPLEVATDLVLQLHLQSSGKPESIQPRVAFYFSDRPPTHRPMKLWLTSYSIDIPAGATNYVLTDSYALPADVDVWGILPHAHYLATTLEAFAILPNLQTNWLLRIAEWDFNWQGDYQYVSPLFLPKGAMLHMRYTYDNSEGNVRNPHQPPRPVRYGLQSTDEMGELWLQILPRSEEGRLAIHRHQQTRVVQDTLAYNQYLLSQNSRDGKAHSGMGRAFYFMGRPNDAFRHFQVAIQLEPDFDEPYYYLGLMQRQQGNLDAAQQSFANAIRLNPENAKAHGNLGMILSELRQFGPATDHLRRALQLDPRDVLARDSLGVALFELGQRDAAEAEFRKALELDPKNKIVQQHLDAVIKARGGRK